MPLLLLPFPTYPADGEECRRLARGLCDLRHNPQHHLDPGRDADPGTAALLAQRQGWVARRPADAAGRRQRWRALRSLTDQLQPAVEGRRREAAEALARCRLEVKANGVLRRRDYAFCLHPEEQLRAFCTRLLSP